MTPEEKITEAERLEQLARAYKRDASFADHGAYGQDMGRARDLGQRALKLRREAEAGLGLDDAQAKAHGGDNQ